VAWCAQSPPQPETVDGPGQRPPFRAFSAGSDAHPRERVAAGGHGRPSPPSPLAARAAAREGRDEAARSPPGPLAQRAPDPRHPGSSHGRRDEVSCPKPKLEEECKPKCIKYLAAYEACAERIKGDKTGEANCVGQYFDYW